MFGSAGSDILCWRPCSLPKRDAGLLESGTPEQAAGNQHFFAERLVNGSVLEYHGEESWFDVHPAIQDLRAFRDACQDYQPKAKESSRPAG